MSEQEPTEQEWLDALKTKDLNFQMFSKAGNKRCRTLTVRVIKKVFSGNRIYAHGLEEILKTGIQKIEESYPEVRDSEPPYHIAHYVNVALKKAGYSFKIDSYNIG